MLICIVSVGHGLCHSFQLLVEIKALNSYYCFYFFVYSPPSGVAFDGWPFQSRNVKSKWLRVQNG